MAEQHDPLHGVLAAEHERQRPALRLDLVHRAEPGGERLLLDRLPALEPPDVAAQAADLGLGAGDPFVETRHLRPLLGERAVDLLELGEERRLLLPRLRRLGALLPELALRLLELPLLGADVVLLLREAGGGDEHQDEGGRGRQPHARPLASHPPTPPSSAPLTSRVATAVGDRNAVWGSPSVRVTSGSSRGRTSR